MSRQPGHNPNLTLRVSLPLDDWLQVIDVTNRLGMERYNDYLVHAIRAQLARDAPKPARPPRVRRKKELALVTA